MTRSPAAPPMRCASAASRCPSDVAVVGFDNWDVMALAARPPLTSVDMNLRALGRAAGERLIAMIAGERLKRRRTAALLTGRAAIVRCRQPDPGRLSRGDSHEPLRPRQVSPMCSLEGKFWHERLETVLTRTIPSQHKKLSEYTASSTRSSCPSRRRRCAFRATPTASPCRCSGTAMSASGSRRRAMRWRIAATTTIEAKIEAIVDDFEKAQRPTAISTAGISATSRTSAGPTCATTTSCIMPATCSKAPSPISEVTGRRRWLDIMERYLDHIYADLRHRARARSAAMTGTRKSSWR